MSNDDLVSRVGSFIEEDNNITSKGDASAAVKPLDGEAVSKTRNRGILSSNWFKIGVPVLIPFIVWYGNIYLARDYPTSRLIDAARNGGNDSMNVQLVEEDFWKDTYQVTSINAEGDTVTYTLIDKIPKGRSIHDARINPDGEIIGPGWSYPAPDSMNTN